MMRHKKMRLDLRAATFLDPCGNEKYYAEKFYAAPDRHSNDRALNFVFQHSNLASSAAFALVSRVHVKQRRE